MLSFHSTSLSVPASLRHALVARLAHAQTPPPPFPDWCLRICSSHHQKDAARTSDEASTTNLIQTTVWPTSKSKCKSCRGGRAAPRFPSLA